MQTNILKNRAVFKCIMFKIVQGEVRKWASLQVGWVKELVIKEAARVGDSCPESWRIEFRYLSMRCKEKRRVSCQLEPVLSCLHNSSSKTAGCGYHYLFIKVFRPLTSRNLKRSNKEKGKLRTKTQCRRFSLLWCLVPITIVCAVWNLGGRGRLLWTVTVAATHR